VSDQPRLNGRCACPERQFGLTVIRGRLRPVRQNLRDDLGIFDAGDHLERPAAAGAGVDLDAERAFEALRPSHCDVARGDRLVGIGLIRTLPFSTHAPMRGCHGNV
jgi:hypothetical protein